MRITNKIMQRNNLSNINTNKIYQDKLSTQMSTQKKISRPSEDPVVAIRSLRLRSNVTEITQYYSKNIPDAESWNKITEDALSNLAGTLTSMIAQCTRGSNEPFTTTDRGIVLEQLKLLSDAVYSTGDADFAGRYVFTGYRTDTPLSFLSEQNREYTITEQLDKSAFDMFTSVNTGKVLDINSTNYNTINNGTAGQKISEDDISSVDVHRIRLAYNDCKEVIPKIEIVKGEGTQPGEVATQVWADKDAATGTPGAITKYQIEMKHTYEDPYTLVAQNDDAVIYVPETGEMLFGKNAYDSLMNLKDNVTTSNVDESEIRITYEKNHWQKGDLRPEHYFYCVADKQDDAGNVVTEADGTTPVRLTYNDTYLTTAAERQVIEYDVGFNQTIRINSTADECFQHGIGREVDDIIEAMQNVVDLEAAKETVNKIMESATKDVQDQIKLKEDQIAKETDATKKAQLEGERDALKAQLDTQMGTLQDQLDAIDKALTYAKNKEQKMFEGGITAFQKYLDDANLCVTACGSRGSKLELIENRTQNQKTTFETLKSENEDVDITEVAIQLTAAELTYDAALMATGKVMQNTLLNFI